MLHIFLKEGLEEILEAVWIEDENQEHPKISFLVAYIII